MIVPYTSYLAVDELVSKLIKNTTIVHTMRIGDLEKRNLDMWFVFELCGQFQNKINIPKN
jgi:hypothetical protein